MGKPVLCVQATHCRLMNEVQPSQPRSDPFWAIRIPRLFSHHVCALHACRTPHARSCSLRPMASPN